MKFKLIIDKEKDEEVVATVHSRTPLIDEMEAVLKGSYGDCSAELDLGVIYVTQREKRVVVAVE